MLPLLFTIAAATSSPTVPPPGVYRYEAFVSGKSAGKAALTVSVVGTGIKLEERSDARTPTGTSSATSMTQLDATLLPIAYHASYTVLDQKMDAAVSFLDRTATVTAGTDTRSFPLGGSSKLFVILDSSLVSGFFILPAQIKALAGADATVLTPGSGGSGFLTVIGGDSPSRPANVPADDVSISFAGDAPFIEWYDPKTMLVDEVLAPGQSLILQRHRY
ncbi:MAG: hypothetical protein M3N19_06250 [Candidatus Eremiobacteraeota bacterium]|nr:hypothetical protein [Candidatus Eremiobacteraeota bacterium]